MLMVRVRPVLLLLVYAGANVALCGIIAFVGGESGIWLMIAVSFFMSIMYPTQFSLALEGLGDQTKSGAAFLVMAIVAMPACRSSRLSSCITMRISIK